MLTCGAQCLLNELTANRLLKNYVFFIQCFHFRIAWLSQMRKFPIVLNTLYYRAFLKNGNQEHHRHAKFYLWAYQENKIFKLWNLVKSPNDIFYNPLLPFLSPYATWVKTLRIYCYTVIYLLLVYHPDMTVSNSREVEIHPQWLLKLLNEENILFGSIKSSKRTLISQS